ncbi:hypothetical protein [Psychrosphaera algicola]|uniref:DUF4410 domain-containing protein n=1 Tax=Psychrosphaera algicola TaxID=3023714 RepID=A0ABT5FGQ2_9GAMM|nr:hypothetical protein [Psychrosphaera sp. G1-22]MDC2890357.1 hypothetical protein [Psychrosphaera sp. G1-22]
MLLFRYFLTIAMVVMLCGCAAQINERTSIKSTEATASNVSVLLEVQPLERIDESKSLTTSIAELKKVISKKYLGSIASASENPKPEALLKITIEQFRHVSGFGRFMAGSMVGDAVLKLNVKLIAVADGRVIHESTLDTQSSFGEGVFGATTSRQIEAMSVKIIDILNSNTAKS